MIQPVSAFSSNAGLSGFGRAYDNRSLSEHQTGKPGVVLKAIGTSLAAGGFVTAITRNYTSSWGQAGFLGLYGSLLTMFFITPFLIQNLHKSRGIERNAKETTDFFCKSRNPMQKKTKINITPKKIPFKQN
ncbi:MAG: hypothetical protein MJ237_02280 [bacterium]|nr:hypothetical protein [bacterium]